MFASLLRAGLQFGYGIALGLKQRRHALEAAAKVAVQEGKQALGHPARVRGTGRGLSLVQLFTGVLAVHLFSCQLSTLLQA